MTTRAAARLRSELLLFGVFRTIVGSLVRLFFRISVQGAEHLPATGAFVLAPVHRSNVDSFATLVLTRRRMRYMGKDSLWKYKRLGRFFTALGGFPVRRGTADREALRRCVEVLEGGEPLVLFPEGTRQSGPIVMPLYDGAAFVAARAGVPIVPVGIGGSEGAMPKGSKLVKPVKIYLIVGEPILPPPPAEGGSGRASRPQVRELTETLHAELQRLYDLAQTRAGH